MTTRPEVIKQSELLNQLVLDRNSLEELGRVEVLWMHPPKHQVLGFVCKSGFLGAKKTAFKLAQLSTLGTNGVLTQGQPEETDADKVRKLESVIGHEIWSDAGNKIGRITDYLFNLKTGAITQYLFISSGWGGIAGDVYQLPPTQILSVGSKRVLVSETTAHKCALYREGIKQRLTKAGDVLKEDYVQATQEWRSLTQRAQSATGGAKERLQTLAEQAKERAHFLSQQAKDRAQTFGEQIKAESQTIAQQAKEKSQTLAEQLKERTQTLGKQVEEGIQTLTVQAEEIFDPDVKHAPNSSPPAPDTTPSDSTSSSHEAKAVDSDYWGDRSDEPDQSAQFDQPIDDDDEPWI
ncbi:PRC-barrel domain-containing protein [Cyanobacteria bacterium FACHB-471]|nr:PRC-barrel domain-containing protein [Cyanobacteria bacterium FACHB-471]